MHTHRHPHRRIVIQSCCCCRCTLIVCSCEICARLSSPFSVDRLRWVWSNVCELRAVRLRRARARTVHCYTHTSSAECSHNSYAIARAWPSRIECNPPEICVFVRVSECVCVRGERRNKTSVQPPCNNHRKSLRVQSRTQRVNNTDSHTCARNMRKHEFTCPARARSRQINENNTTPLANVHVKYMYMYTQMRACSLTCIIIMRAHVLL